MTTQTYDEVMSHRIGADGLLVLRVHDGEIRVRGVGGDVATVRATDGRPLAGLEIEGGDRSLSIRSRRGPDFDFGFGFGRRDRSRGHGRTRSLELEVPAGATVVVEGASADVDVQDTNGDQRYRSASGDLVLRGVRGSLTIEAISGDVEVDADGPATIRARTVSGNLGLRAASIAELRATTTSGDLQISGQFDGAGPYAIETVSGDATLAPADDVRIEARTITGDIHSDLPSRRDDAGSRRALVIGAGGPTITFRSTSGDLRVVAATPSAAPRTVAPPNPPAAPSSSEAHDATTPPDADPDHYARLDILRALERGDIDVTEAGRRLEGLDHGEPTETAGTTAMAGEDDHA